MTNTLESQAIGSVELSDSAMDELRLLSDQHGKVNLKDSEEVVAAETERLMAENSEEAVLKASTDVTRQAVFRAIYRAEQDGAFVPVVEK